MYGQLCYIIIAGKLARNKHLKMVQYWFRQSLNCIFFKHENYPPSIFHIMNIFSPYSDTFDENTPPVDDVEYISSLGSAIFGGMQAGDSNAVWLMQVIVSSFFHVRGC